MSSHYAAELITHDDVVISCLDFMVVFKPEIIHVGVICDSMTSSMLLTTVPCHVVFLFKSNNVTVKIVGSVSRSFIC